MEGRIPTTIASVVANRTRREQRVLWTRDEGHERRIRDRLVFSDLLGGVKTAEVAGVSHETRAGAPNQYGASAADEIL